MAPSAVTTEVEAIAPVVASLKLGKSDVERGDYKELFTYSYEKDVEEGGIGAPAAKYTNYLPTWNPDQKYPGLTPFEHVEHGLDADASYPNLLPAAAVASDLTPKIGTEVRGVQLSNLSAAGKDELAHLVAHRKVVAFRDQDFASLPIGEALAYGGYFGRHHIHPTSGSPEGHPEIHLVHRAAGDKAPQDAYFAKRTSSVAWHSDVSYELQPPGTTFLYVLDLPATGGDTLFADCGEAYRRLSPEFRQRLHGLKAIHSGFEQVDAAKVKGGINRREPVAHEHPVVRTHPVTGEKVLYVNPQFTREIAGYKKEESDYLLKFLYDHIAYGADFHVRVRWEPGTVVVWDNRATQHSALVDWNSGERRHLARITPQAERPYETPFEG